MRRLLILALALASCSSEPPEPVVVKKSPPKMAAAPSPVPLPAPPPPEPALPPPPAVPKPPPPPEPKVFRANVELVLEAAPPQENTDPGRIYLPAFTIRTMDHEKVDVGVNGYRFSMTSCLWAVHQGLEFDPKIRVPVWPPAGAKYVGATRKGEDHAEVYIAAGEDANAAHLKNGEHVLYVKGRIGFLPMLGALRLYVGKPGQPYRYTNYNPAMNMESEEASKFARTMWFEPTKNGE